jgi:hypothetical protein
LLPLLLDAVLQKVEPEKAQEIIEQLKKYIWRKREAGNRETQAAKKVKLS